MNVINSQILKLAVEKAALYLTDINQQYTLNQDYYWLVGSDKWDDFSSSPVAHQVGSLTDDWHYLQRLANADEAVSVTDPDRLAALLWAISEQISSTTGWYTGKPNSMILNLPKIELLANRSSIRRRKVHEFASKIRAIWETTPNTNFFMFSRLFYNYNHVKKVNKEKSKGKL